MRALATIATLVLAGCSTLLGIEDPSAGDDAPRTLESIAIGPDPLMLPLGVMQQLSATAVYSDDTEEDVSQSATWALVSGSSISVSPSGLVNAVQPGSAMVSATFDGVTGTTVANVGTAAPQRVRFEIGDFGLMQQQRMRLKVTLILTDGSMQDASGTATLTSDNDAIATSPGPGLVDAGTTPGMATITARAFTATPATIRATVGTVACHPLVNEIVTGQATPPMTGGANEYVEIFNPCATEINVNTWTLVYRAATNDGGADNLTMVTLSGSMPANDLRLYAGESFPGPSDGTWVGMTGIMQQNSAGVGLRNDVGQLVDSLAYGPSVVPNHPFIEGTVAPMMVNGMSASRLPFDGRDTNDNGADFMVITTLTPRARNAP